MTTKKETLNSGVTIWDASRQMCNLAAQDGIAREFVLNGVTVIAKPNSCYSDLADLYTTKKILNRYKNRFGELP